MADLRENVIEFYADDKRATVTFTQGRYVSRIKRFAEEKPDECQIVAENKDGSIVAHIPTRWVKISPTREVSEEQKEAARERLIKFHEENRM